MPDLTAFERITSLVEAVEKDDTVASALPVQDRLTVALTLNRADLLVDFTMLEAMERLGADMLASALATQRARSGQRIISYALPSRAADLRALGQRPRPREVGE
jgi:anti-anti-sigma regulatory factor